MILVVLLDLGCRYSWFWWVWECDVGGFGGFGKVMLLVLVDLGG